MMTRATLIVTIAVAVTWWCVFAVAEIAYRHWRCRNLGHRWNGDEDGGWLCSRCGRWI